MTLNEYIEKIKHKRICVIGIGVSNTPLIKTVGFRLRCDRLR